MSTRTRCIYFRLDRGDVFASANEYKQNRMKSIRTTRNVFHHPDARVSSSGYEYKPNHNSLNRNICTV